MLEYSTTACAVPAHVPGTETPPALVLSPGGGQQRGAGSCGEQEQPCGERGSPQGWRGLAFPPPTPDYRGAEAGEQSTAAYLGQRCERLNELPH